MSVNEPTAPYSSLGSTSSSLLDRVKAYDDEAWRRLVSMYGPVVFRRAQAAGLDAESAADVVQDVFASVSRTVGGFGKRHDKGSFRGWLRRITANKIIDVFRRLDQQPRGFGGSDAQDHLANISDELEGVPELSPDDERTLLLRAALENIRSDFETHNWQAFWRTAVDGRTSSEAADELGMKPDAVRRAKFRVLNRLRAELGELFDD